MRAWPTPLDPRDFKDYTLDFTADMTDTSDTIDSFVVTLPSDGAIAGLVKSSESVSSDGLRAIVFYNIKTENENDIIFDNRQTYHIVYKATTVGGRILTKGASLYVKRVC